MNKYSAKYLCFTAGVLFAISSVINFGNGYVPMGISYFGLAIVFIALGLSYQKNNK